MLRHAKPGGPAKRAVIRKVLVNIAWNVKHIEVLNDKAEKASENCKQREVFSPARMSG